MIKTIFKRILGVTFILMINPAYANYIRVGGVCLSWVSNGKPPFSVRNKLRKSLRIGKFWVWFSRTKGDLT